MPYKEIYKTYPFFQGEVESTEKKWVFCWKTLKKL